MGRNVAETGGRRSTPNGLGFEGPPESGRLLAKFVAEAKTRRSRRVLVTEGRPSPLGGSFSEGVGMGEGPVDRETVIVLSGLDGTTDEEDADIGETDLDGLGGSTKLCSIVGREGVEDEAGMVGVFEAAAEAVRALYWSRYLVRCSTLA